MPFTMPSLANAFPNPQSAGGIGNAPLLAAILNQQQQKAMQMQAATPYAGQLAQGQANIAKGIGQQELGTGQYAAPSAYANLQQQQQAAQQAGILTQQQQQLLKIWPTLTLQQKLQAIAATQQQQAEAKYAPQQQQAEVVQKVAPAYGIAIAHPGAAAATAPTTQSVLGAVKGATSGLGTGAGPVFTGQKTQATQKDIGSLPLWRDPQTNQIYRIDNDNRKLYPVK